MCAFVKRNCQWVLYSAPPSHPSQPSQPNHPNTQLSDFPTLYGAHAYHHHECRCINRSGPNQNPGKVITSLVMCTCHCGICLINKNARVPAPRTMPLPLPPRLQLHLCGLWVLSGDPDQTPHPSVREPKKPCGCQSSFVFVICALMSYTFECVFACPSHCPS